MKHLDEESPDFRNLGSRINDFLDSDPKADEESEHAGSAPILQSLDESRYHFTNEEFLVAGGAKKISRVYDSHSGRHVAMANPLRWKTESEKEEFLREAQLTAKLQHPNILPIHEVGLNSAGEPYFIMRLLEGEELKNIVRERTAGNEDYLQRFDLDTLLEIYLKVCDAVIYAHSRGVLHLDLKPANIMVGRYGLVTLFDWGLARVVGDDGTVMIDQSAEEFDPDLLNNVTHSGMLKGTPGYMAPEQVTDYGQVCARTDVYALGAILYFILTGTIPVSGTHAEEVIENTVAGNIVRPRMRRPNRNIPTSLGAVAMKALQLETRDRYASVQALHDEVTRYLRGFAPAAENAHILKRSQLFMRRHSKMVFTLMMFGMVLTVVIAVLLARVSVQRSQALTAKREAIHNLALYKEETKTSQKLYTDVQSFFVNSIMRGDIWNYSLMRRMVNNELQKPDLDEKYRKQLFQMKAYLHFINEEFSAAVQAFDQAKFDQKNNLYKQCLYFLEIKPDDQQLLEPAHFSELLDMPYRNTLFRKNILSRCYERHMARAERLTPQEYLPIAIAILNLTNDTLGWGDHVKLEPREGGHHLNLRNAPYHTLRLTETRWGQGASILLPLDLVSLDLSGSHIHEFHGLKLQDRFEELILLGLKFYDPEPNTYWLGKIPMERLVITAGAIPRYHLERFPQHIEVIEIPQGRTYP
ncbi:Serine/threonine-protein kinase PknD [Pontiella desulfatans]|uniref:Serine/threonine-protein kinase PknD n=1 Tax=Pontiella desulfatans TaxID=2750659 RepID=A0A6C2UAG0_PONDE|nr:serine/threonine-protein kinase [Pontiella desulfatans]VGO16356.1 Serine/threonine-protein kinase PknD [Pontiella desulfatans]